MNRPTSITYLIAPFIPFILMIGMFTAGDFTSDAGLAVMGLAWFLSIVVFFFYTAHIVKNKTLTRGTKPLWILLTLLSGALGTTSYWFIYIRQDDTHQVAA